MPENRRFESAAAHTWRRRLGLLVFAIGLIVSVSMLIVPPNPQDESAAFENSLQRFAGRGAIGIALLVAGQAMQNPRGAGVQARLARMIAADRAKAARPRSVWPDWPSNRTWVNPTLGNRIPRPHAALRARRSETSL